MSEFRDFHTMELKDGRVITPLSDYDVLNEIYDYMGQDVHDYVADRTINAMDDFDNRFFGLESEMRSYEQSCEHWHNFVGDTSERIINLVKKIEDNKLTKAKICVELFNIYSDMRGEL